MLTISQTHNMKNLYIFLCCPIIQLKVYYRYQYCNLQGVGGSMYRGGDDGAVVDLDTAYELVKSGCPNSNF
jgi:hypothetical protein